MPKVLLIEDTPEMQRMYGYGLTKAGFEVEIVGSAGEALAHVQSGIDFDVILVDLMLAGMSGLDFLKSANLRTLMPGAKIVVLTNVDNPEIIDKVKVASVDDYLVKSQTDPIALANHLQQMLQSVPPLADPLPKPAI